MWLVVDNRDDSIVDEYADGHDADTDARLMNHDLAELNRYYHRYYVIHRDDYEENQK